MLHRNFARISAHIRTYRPTHFHRFDEMVRGHDQPAVLVHCKSQYYRIAWVSRRDCKDRWRRIEVLIHKELDCLGFDGTV